jgi:hypothetical protein
MSPVARAWIACAAVGAGLLHVAVALGRPLELAAVLFVVGTAEFAWGALVLAWSRLLAPRVALAGAFVPGILWLIAIIARVPGVPVLPLATATALELLAAMLIARGIRGSGSERALSPVALAIAVVVIAAITLPALAFTQSEVGTTQLPSPEHGHR